MIGITQRLKEESTKEVRESLNIEWGAFFKEDLFYPLSYEVDFNNYKNLCDMFILSGGNELYSLNPTSLNKKRDEYEKQIISHCVKNKIPLLGVSHGAQIIAEFFSSELRAYLREEACLHKITHTKLNISYSVNSYHNFAISLLGEELDSIFIDEHSQVEAFKHKNLPILGMMWHIEREENLSDASKIIYEDFLSFR